MKMCYATIAKIEKKEIVLEIDDEEFSKKKGFDCSERKTHLKRIPICSFRNQGFEVNQEKVYIVKESFEEGWIKIVTTLDE